MKKVLILAYDFPPYVSVGGLRPYAWYKYFYEFDLYPIVVTRQWGNKYGNYLDYIAPGESKETIIEESEIGTIIRTPYKPNFANCLLLKYGEYKFRLLRKAISGFYEFAQFILPVGTKAGLYKSAKKYLKQNKVDAIIATGDPFVLFSFANKLSKKYNTPWIADYRDPWVQDKATEKGNLRIKFEKYLEKNIVNNAKGITTVSSLLKNLIYQNVKKDIPLRIFINGFDNAHLSNVEYPIQKRKLIISYSGSLYPWHPFEYTLQLLNDLVNKGLLIQLQLFGCNDIERINKALMDMPYIQKSTKIFPKLSNEELMKELQQSHLLLLFNDYSISGTKIYDYLAAKKTIILCFSNDEEALQLKKKYFYLPKIQGESEQLQIEILEKTNGGIIIKNQEHFVEEIQYFYQKFKNEGDVICKSHSIEQFSRKNTTKLLAQFINQIISE